MQNLAPAGFDVEQLAQATPVGAGAAAAAGAGAGGGGGGGACCCWNPAAEPAAESEARGQERALGGAAALGHALPGAERHLACRVLTEAARQLGVRGVLGQLLQLGRVLGRQVDVEVAHPADRDPVGLELPVAGRDGGLLDLRRVHRQAEDRPPVGDDLRGDVGAEHLEHLVAHPAGDPLVVGHVDGGGQVGDQPRRVDDAQRVVAEDSQRHDQTGPRVLDVVHPSAELEAGVLAGADEVELRPVGVAAGREVDDRAEAGDLVGVNGVTAGTHGCRDLAGVDEHRHFIGVDDRVREAADRYIGPLENDLTLTVIRYRDKFPRKQCHARNDTVEGRVKAA